MIKNTVISFIFFYILSFHVHSTEKFDGSVSVNVSVINMTKLTVQKPGGGWYTTMTLDNSTGPDTSVYQNSIPVQIILSGVSGFYVSLYEPLVLKHNENPSLQFTIENIFFGKDNNLMRSISEVPVKFSMTERENGKFKENFMLKIVARQPTGQINNITGSYSGSLTIMFEPSL